LQKGQAARDFGGTPKVHRSANALRQGGAPARQTAVQKQLLTPQS